MIAVVAGIRVGVGSRRTPRIWIPLPVIWLLLLPFAVVLLPLSVVACLMFSVPPLRALGVLGRILGGLAGTRIDVDAPGASFLITFH